MAEVKIDKISVFVRENLDDDPFEKVIAMANSINPKGSTVGVKIHAGSEVYGNYVCFAQSTLSAAEVAESINELLDILLKEAVENGRS